MKTIPENLPPFAKLRWVLKALRAPDGCPWDREQTLSSIKPCLQEEAYELLAAMDSDDLANHKEELGDVLLQILFQSDIREDKGDFSFDDVVLTLTEKLIRRHPHVFGDVAATDSSQVLKNWEQIKQTEHSVKHSALDGVPEALPALLKAQRTQGKANRVGFDWKDSQGPQQKMTEEIAELNDAILRGNDTEIFDEIGDCFFTLVNLCRFLNVDAESATRAATEKFARRFRAVEAVLKEEKRDMKSLSLEELDKVWDAVKEKERNSVK